MLAAGIYLAPPQFDAGFLSAGWPTNTVGTWSRLPIERDTRFKRQRIKVVEVADVWQAHSRAIYAAGANSVVGQFIQGDGVFCGDARSVQIGNDPQHRQAAACLEKGNAIGAQSRVPAKLVNHQTLNQLALVRLQQPERTQ